MHLNSKQLAAAHKNLLRGCDLLLRDPPGVHYTQGLQRWEGLDHRLRVVKGQYPRHGDCSSTATWLLWNALTHGLHDLTIDDVVNGAAWRAGYTGTMVEHGHHIEGLTQIGDCAFYGHGWPYEHVTVYIGNGYVFSHGGEAGPFKLPAHYRGDLATRRRYLIHKR